MAVTKMERSAYSTMLNESRMQAAGQISVELDVAIPPGVPFSDILEYSYWKQCSKTMRVRNKMKIFSDDNAYYAELVVLAVEQGIGAVVHPVIYVDLGAEAKKIDLPSAADGFEIKNKGFLGWCVTRKKDNTVVSQNNASELEARNALAGIIQARAG